MTEFYILSIKNSKIKCLIQSSISTNKLAFILRSSLISFQNSFEFSQSFYFIVILERTNLLNLKQMQVSTSLPLRESYGKVVKVILEKIKLFCFLLQYYFVNTLRTLHMLYIFTLYFIMSHDSLVVIVLPVI